MIGFLAYSLAGHDKDALYLIIEETKDFCICCGRGSADTRQTKEKE